MKALVGAERGPAPKGPAPVRPAPSSRRPAVPLLWAAMRKAISPAPPSAGVAARVSSPGDRLEKEADRVADEVTKEEKPRTASPPAGVAAPQPPEPPRSRPACKECSKLGPCAWCRGVVQRAAIAGPAAGLAPAFARAPDFFPRSAGRPLGATVRRDLEPRFGLDFGAVRIHTDAAATAAAAGLSARAFTLGPDIFFGRGEYAPATSGGRRLMAHELAHVVQQGQGLAPPMVQRQMAPSAPAGASAVSAAALIDEHTSLLDLKEQALGRALASRALRGDHGIVHRVLSELSSTDRDDVALAFMQVLSLPQLRALEASVGGRHVLDRVLDELTSGSVAKEEQAEADWILAIKKERIGPAKFGEGGLAAGALVFPLRLGGPTVLDPAPIFATLGARGMVHVKIPVAVLGTKKFAEEVRTLPSKVATSGLDLPADQIVGVRLYDFGGIVQFMPAVQLVELSNRQTRETIQKVVEVAAIAATLGTGALLGAGARGATLGARVLLAADRVATAIGIITLVIQDHRGGSASSSVRTGSAFCARSTFCRPWWPSSVWFGWSRRHRRSSSRSGMPTVAGGRPPTQSRGRWTGTGALLLSPSSTSPRSC